MKSKSKTSRTGLKITERELQENILQILQLAGITTWLTHKVGAYKHKPIIKGISDIIGVLEKTYRPLGVQGTVSVGQFLAIEVKLPGRRTTYDQELFLEAVNEAGGIGFVAYSEQDVIEKLNITNLCGLPWSCSYRDS